MPEKRGFILFGSPHQSGATARLVQAFLKAFPEETEWTMVAVSYTHLTLPTNSRV